METIAQLNLRHLFNENRDEYINAVIGILDQSAFIGGKAVEIFESQFAEWIGGNLRVVGCGNGTDAITLAALAMKLPPGSEAIVPAMTFFATAEGLMHAGLKLKLVDIDPVSWVMDPRELEKAISKRTSLIAPVHLYGQMAAMDRIREIADRHGARVLEDASQAHGARWKNMPVGHWGDVATYSFYPGKNLGAFGDAGAVVTRAEAIAEQVRTLASHGGRKRYQHDIVGFNSRLDGIQAAALAVKLRFIDRWNARRREVAAAYQDGLRGLDRLQLPAHPPEAFHVYHQYPVQVDERERFMTFLKERGIETSIHYPNALHQLPALSELAGQRFPAAERLAARCVSLPMCPSLTPPLVNRVIEAIHAYFKKS